MSASTVAGTAAQLDAGRVIRQGFAVVRRRWPTFLACALVVATIDYGSSALTAALQVAEKAGPSQGLPMLSNLALYLLVVVFLIQPLAVNVMSWTAWADAAGVPSDLASAAGVVGRRAVKLLLTNLGLLLILLVGFLLLFIPGLWLSVALAVALPASVVEDLGPQGALRRSFDLTRGQRWRIFAFGILTGLIAIGAAFVLGLATLVFGLNINDPANPVAAILSAVEQGLLGVLIAALTGSLYAELVRLNGGGVGAAATAEVFA
jgi:hypothetical protein